MRKVSSSDRLWSSLFGQLLFSPQLLIQKRSHSQTTGFQNFFVTIYLYFKLLNFTKHILDSFGYNCFIRSFIWCSEIFHRFFFLLLCVFLKCGTDYNLKIKFQYKEYSKSTNFTRSASLFKVYKCSIYLTLIMLRQKW